MRTGTVTISAGLLLLGLSACGAPVPFSRGQLYLMLKCVTFTGQIGHYGKLYAGKHPAIIDADTFERVQAMLNDNTRGSRTRAGRAHTSLLAGKIVDSEGKPLIATHATRPVASHGGEGKARYRYYVSRDLHHGDAPDGMRIPAREIERLVLNRVGELFRDPVELIAAAWLEIAPGAYTELHRRCEDLASTTASASLALSVITQVRVAQDGVTLTCSAKAIAKLVSARQQDGAPAEVVIDMGARLTRSGRVLRLVHAGNPGSERISTSLVGLLSQAHRWWAELRKGEIPLATLASREGVTGSYLTRVLRLAFLSPAITQAILAGRQPVWLDVRALTLRGSLEANWAAQASRYGQSD